MMVCGTCGVEVAQSRSGRWVHTDLLGTGVGFHEIYSPISRDAWFNARVARDSAKATEDARSRISALRARMSDPAMAAVAWTEVGRDAVALLNMVENLEQTIRTLTGEPT